MLPATLGVVTHVPECALGLHAGPAFVEQVDRDSSRLAERASKALGRLGFGSSSPVHVARVSHDDPFDFPFLDQFTQGGNIGFAPDASQGAGRKGEAGLGIREREADPFASEIQTEHTHAGRIVAA